MAVDERRRLEAFRDLADAIGDEATRTVFALIEEPRPDPSARGDVATLRSELGDVSRQVRELSTQLQQLSDRMERSFQQVDARFAQVDVRFEQVDARFEQVDARFEQVDARFTRVDERFAEAREHVDVRIDALRHELVATFETGLREAVVGQTRIIVISLVTAFAAVSAVALRLA